MEELYTMHTLMDLDTPENKTSSQSQSNAPDFPDFMELAQAYVRPQPLEGVFSPEEGLKHGTAFPNLSQPYKGRMLWKPC